MNKNTIALLTAAFCAASLAGCGKGRPDPDLQDAAAESAPVELTVWGSEEDEALLSQIIRDFTAAHQGEAKLRITFVPQGESQCKDVLLAGPKDGADVFTFADDQISALAAAGVLEPVPEPEAIQSAGLPSAVEAASVDGVLYAWPLTADNGYFLYYNKDYFTQSDVQTLDRILEIAAAQDRTFCMDWSSAWYVYAFFGNTGMEVGLSADGITNYCTWNSQEGAIRGADVAQAMLDIAESPGFESRTDTEFLEGVKDGSVIAGVSGVWNAVAIEEAWGTDTGASKLPTYTCNGSQIQMASFSGCKLIGVNAYSKHPVWASRLAEWITNEENQRLRFEMRGQGPSDLTVADSAEIKESPAIAALLAQSEYAQLQRVGGKFWDPVSEFAGNLAAGNPSGESLQKQLDKMTEGVCER